MAQLKHRLLGVAFPDSHSQNSDFTCSPIMILDKFLSFGHLSLLICKMETLLPN